MSKSFKLALVGALVLAVGAATMAVAAGSRKDVRTNLTGYEEVPAVSTDGGGSFRAMISPDGTQLAYELTFGGLGSTVTQAHIHFGQTAVNGGISIFLCTDLGNGPAGTQGCPDSGTISGTVGAADVIGPSAQGIAPGEFAEIVAAIRAGVAYVNVHTAQFPGGEIRGQLP